MLKRLLPILLILCLLLGACHSTPTTEASTKTATEAATEERVASQESSSEESAPLSELFLEDYDQLWQILEEDYPYLDYLKTQIPDPVYSSSDNFACFCKDTGWATLVGQTTGGDGLHSMPVLAPLKNTGILFRFSGAAGEGPGGIPNAIQGVEPDHPCESDGDALEYCLELIRQETP